MVHPLFADDYKLEAYWLDQAPPPDLPEPVQPESADVAIVGSGYTGLSAALTGLRVARTWKNLSQYLFPFDSFPQGG